MIDLKELRLGNIVLLDNVVCPPNFICGRPVKLDIFPEGEIYNDPKLSPIQAIPLTEDWLLKFGFQSTYEEFDEEDFPCVVEYWLFTDSVTRFEIDYATKTGYTVNIANVPTGHALIIRRKLEYVHQLQNLYFALTGKELEFKN